MLLHVITVVCVLHVTSAFYCIGTCYSGSFPKEADIVIGKGMLKCSYKIIYTGNPQKCFSSCVNDCRCKAFQIKDSQCSLLDEDKTSKKKWFKARAGYVYYDLQQEFYKGPSHMVQPGVCYNGCCKFHPCLNGGTCMEHCHSPKQKFTCSCSAMFIGNVCENRIYHSCMDVLRMSENGAIPTNGIYRIFPHKDDDSKLRYRNMHCAFVAPNQAWTLFQSFSLENKGLVRTKAFYQGFPVNDTKPNWNAYRLRLITIRHFLTNATMFRSTCDFPKRSSLTPDYLFGYLKDAKIFTRSSGNCFKYAHINIRGQDFYDTKASTWNVYNNCHFHLDCSASVCGFPIVNNVVSSEDSFGFYEQFNPDSKCTEKLQSTTQWWLGEEK